MPRVPPSKRTPARERPGPSRGPRAGLGFYSYTVRDVMTRKVVEVRPEDSLATAARLMSRHGISGLPVVGKSRRIIGVLSQKDIVRLLHQSAGLRLPGSVFDLILSKGKDAPTGIAERSLAALERSSVRSVMNRPAVTISPDASIDEAVRSLIAHRINRLPVAEGGFVVGIVTRHDLLTGMTPGEPVEP